MTVLHLEALVAMALWLSILMAFAWSCSGKPAIAAGWTRFEPLPSGWSAPERRSGR